jgi:hypothetical protein
VIGDWQKIINPSIHVMLSPVINAFLFVTYPLSFVLNHGFAIIFDSRQRADG